MKEYSKNLITKTVNGKDRRGLDSHAAQNSTT